MEQCDVVHVNGNANFWRPLIGGSGQEGEEHSIGAIVELLYRVGMDVAADHVPGIQSALSFD